MSNVRVCLNKKAPVFFSIHILKVMNTERFHNQLALHLGYKRILDRNIDIHVDDLKDEIWITIEVKQPKMMILFNPSVDPVSTVWTEQISAEQKRLFGDFNIEGRIKAIIEKVCQAHIQAVSCKL